MDHATGKIFIFGLKSRADAIDIQQTAAARIETHIGRPVREWYADGDGVFTTTRLHNLFLQKGTKQLWSLPTVHQHGPIDRFFRTAQELVETNMVHCSAPEAAWFRALMHCNFVWERLPRYPTIDGEKTQNLSILNLWNKNKTVYPDKLLRVFGAKVIPHNYARSRKRMPGNKVYKADTNLGSELQDEWVLIGMSEVQKGYICRNVQTGKVKTFHHVTTFEDQFPFKNNTPPKIRTSFRQILDPD
jgi:hypothetical protein